jgi:putative transposase
MFLSKIKVWQDEYHPEAIYSEKWFHQKLSYLHDNPVRKGFVSRCEDWKYSSARNWLLDDHSLIQLDLNII